MLREDIIVGAVELERQVHVRLRRDLIRELRVLDMLCQGLLARLTHQNSLATVYTELGWDTLRIFLISLLAVKQRRQLLLLLHLEGLRFDGRYFRQASLVLVKLVADLGLVPLIRSNRSCGRHDVVDRGTRLLRQRRARVHVRVFFSIV